MAQYSDLNYLIPTNGNRVEDADSVFQAVYTLLNTKKKQRAFRPEYGSSLHSYLFEPCDDTTAFQILQEIVTTLSQEPRVVLNMAKTKVQPIPDKSMFFIELNFTILGFGSTEKTLQLVLKK